MNLMMMVFEEIANKIGDVPYNVKLCRVRVITDGVDTQECILCVLLSYISLSSCVTI